MEYDFIPISKINDFIFCPKSIYFHSVYEKFDQRLYHETPQFVGKLKHENIDGRLYSSAKKYLQGLEVSSEKYGLIGKIDIYDQKDKSLIERKNKIKKIYDGYRFQLYAQMVCLEEMGYEVKRLFIHSLSDNKRYKIDLPGRDELNDFFVLLGKIRNFDPLSAVKINKNKCSRCIYRELCHDL